MTERITVDAVEAAVVEFDAAERAVVVGQVVMTFGQVGIFASMFAPREWEEVAAYLLALVDRAPLKEGRAYAAHRALISAIAQELRGYARVAGEPVGLEVDLRAATSKAEERRIRERIGDQQAALDRHLDDISHQNGTDHESTIADIERVDALMDAATRRALAEEDERMTPDSEEPATDTVPTAAPAIELDDDLARWT